MKTCLAEGCDKALLGERAQKRGLCFTCWVGVAEDPKRARNILPPAPLEWFEFLENLPALRQLCHPDKHGQSEGSVRITAWLTEVKNVHGK